MEQLNLKMAGVGFIEVGEIVSKLSIAIRDADGNKVIRKDNILESGDTVYVESVKSSDQFQANAGEIKADIDDRVWNVS